MYIVQNNWPICVDGQPQNALNIRSDAPKQLNSVTTINLGIN